jgi:hypothetical protein
VALSVECRLSGRHLPHVDEVEAQVLEVVETIFLCRVWGEMTACRLAGSPEFGKMLKQWKLIFSSYDFMHE